jgi:hypothetical protein
MRASWLGRLLAVLAPLWDKLGARPWPGQTAGEPPAQ